MKSSVFRFAIASALLCTAIFAAAKPITVIDIAGRQVSLPQPAQRVILADARAVQALQIVNPDNPFKHLVAWDNALKNKAPDLYSLYTKKFPELSKLPMLENAYLSDFSVESVVPLKPDLIVFDFGVLPKLKASGVLDQLAAIGVPVVFIDFRLRPLKNSVPSIQLLGKVMGDEKRADQWAQFYDSRLKMISDRTASLSDHQRPLVFIERHAGMTGDACCFTYGKGAFGEFITTAGGQNVGSQYFDGKNVVISLEQLIAAQPVKYIMTGADWSTNYKQSIGVALGYGADKARVQKQIVGLMDRMGVKTIPAAKSKEVMAVYHQYYDSALNIMAVEAFAKFIHPELFADLNPDADNETIHNVFLKMPEPGIFWEREAK